MSGFNRTLDARQAEVNLAVLLQDYILASSKFATDQSAITALLKERLFKKPSVYQSLSAFDGIRPYAFPAADPLAIAFTAIGNGTAPTVYVFRIGDADLIKIRSFTYDITTTSDPYAPFMAWALSGQDSPCPASDFSMVQVTATSSLVGTFTSNNAVWLADEIPCSGNKYLHLFGYNQDAADLIAACQDSTNAFFSLQLIK